MTKKLLILLAALLVATGLAVPAAMAGAPYSCTTTTLPHGTCGPYGNYAGISLGEPSASPPTVDQNAWGATSSYRSTLEANSPGDWRVTATVTSNSGAIQSFPNTGWGMAWPEKPVDGYATLPSSWDVTIPNLPTIAGWAAYDLWFNNWADEVMIQVDIQANSNYNCTGPNTATFNGTPWHECVFGSERVWKPGTTDPAGGFSQLTPGNQPVGSMDIQPILTWMESHGQLPANSTWTAGSFGFEIADTGSVAQTFTLSGFTFATSGTGPTPTPTTTSPTPTPTPTTTMPAPAPAGLSQSPHVIVNFSWGAVTGTNDYQFQLRAPNGTIVVDQPVTGTHLNSLEVVKDTNYQWRVRAAGGTWSSWRAFTSP